MSASPESGQGGSPKIAVKLPIVTLLLVVIFAVWLGVAGAAAALLVLVKSGRFAAFQTSGAGVANSSGPASHSIVLDPILVNLADQGGRAYLRLGVTLDVENDATSAGDHAIAKTAGVKPNEQETSVRDTLLMVLGEQTSASLLGPDGKEHLKLELVDAIRRREPKLKLKDLFFTDFLVQI